MELVPLNDELVVGKGGWEGSGPNHVMCGPFYLENSCIRETVSNTQGSGSVKLDVVIAE